MVADGNEEVGSHCDPVVYSYWQRIWLRLTYAPTDSSSKTFGGRREGARRMLRRLSGVSAGPSMVGQSNPRLYDSVSGMLLDAHNSIGRQLRQVVNRREMKQRYRRGDREYDRPWSDSALAWFAIIGTLVLGLGAGALLHKMFIKAPTDVTKGMTVVQAKRMGFQALGDGKGPVGVVSAVDDDDEDEDEDEEAPR